MAEELIGRLLRNDANINLAIIYELKHAISRTISPKKKISLMKLKTAPSSSWVLNESKQRVHTPKAKYLRHFYDFACSTVIFNLSPSNENRQRDDDDFYSSILSHSLVDGEFSQSK